MTLERESCWVEVERSDLVDSSSICDARTERSSSDCISATVLRRASVMSELVLAIRLSLTRCKLGGPCRSRETYVVCSSADPVFGAIANSSSRLVFEPSESIVRFDARSAALVSCRSLRKVRNSLDSET